MAADRRDEVDRIRSEWAEHHPKLDTATIDVVGRILRTAAIVTKRGDALLAEFGLTRGEFDILAALRRQDLPQSPGSLRTVALASGPAITKRLRSLESRLLVQRSPNPIDGRGALIALSGQGIALTDEVFPRMLGLERDLLAGIPSERAPHVVDALRLVLASVESRG
ncbi:MarR family transcriptional regulator [Microbacterium betulae]|uniref:MarR family transcriptional regulator n=1 Tax=Microbacterium betulae TaxID=2981139 RepID=A0AA97FHY4_9MICO|nr:MarR family transcriptional regulator [Microbacterium sp. AB]WOF23916.1 MarR family transcriptional regulator [Microbacterium sp. AB]